MRNRLAQLVEVVGLVGITAAATAVNHVLGLFVGSVFVVLAGYSLERES